MAPITVPDGDSIISGPITIDEGRCKDPIWDFYDKIQYDFESGAKKVYAKCTLCEDELDAQARRLVLKLLQCCCDSIIR